MELIVEEYNFPGMTAAYVLPDGTVVSAFAGFSDRELKISMGEDSRMLAASIGKTFIAAVVLHLVREGKLDLDVPVRVYIGSENWFSRLPGSQEISLRHLLTHSSGIENHVDSPEFIKAVIESQKGPALSMKPEKLISFVLDVPSKFRPGEGFHYSDTGYILAGLIVEKVTGDHLFEEVSTRILLPLNLNMTEPSDRKNLPNLAAGYLSPDNSFQLPAKTTLKPGLMLWNPGIEWAGGGFVSTSRDLAVWGDALYTGRALPGNYLTELLQGVRAAPGFKYGMGTVIKEDPELDVSYGHKGWIPGYCSSLKHYKKNKITVAFQINTDIGIFGNDRDVLDDIEKRLARILFNHKGPQAD
ncbi:MAG: beta-lactamase family protein [Spirochaetia bacterium]|nr:beta-lactamase family protein [Spirochaetia bacterium]